MRVVVYTKPGCQPCKATTRWLTNAGIPHEELPAAEHADYLMTRLEAQEVPVVVISTDTGTPVVWASGYRPDWLTDIFGSSPAVGRANG